jgi:hypothetical protein
VPHLQFLAGFFSWLFHLGEVWAALIGIVGALIGAFVGGRIAGRYALRAQEQAAKDQRTRDRETESETISGTLEAIATEVEIFKVKFLDAFKRVFEVANPEASPADSIKFARMNQSLFSVFDSNAAIVGRIPDAKLRRKIVATYITLKALVDVVNHYTEKQEEWTRISHQSNIPGGGILELKGGVEKWAGNIRRYIPDLENEIIDLLAEIRKYLDRRK